MFDYVFANKLIFNGDTITGKLEIHNQDLRQDFISNRVYSICKSCVLEDLAKDLGFKLDETIAIGDGIVDIGMIKKAGLGIAFNASDTVNKHANIVTNDMRTILKYI
jgi:phosphoserine phosphatase